MATANIKISADTQQAQAAIQNLNKSLSSIERSSQAAQKGLGTLAQTTQLAVGAFAALTAGLGIRELADYTARWTDLNSRLVNATGSQQAASQALEAISASARTTYSSLEETAKVFVRNSMAMNELGYTTNEQIKLSETLNNAIAVSGARGQEAASALDAFAQAIARGKMEGGDFNRIIETSPRIVKALADGLGVTTAEFRAMITEGRITSDVMIPALISQMDKLRTEAEAMPATLSDAFIVLQNSLFEFIGSADQALGISQALSKALVFLADNTGIMVGAIAGLAVAVAALLIPLIPAATAMAVLTGGLAVAGAVAVGAALGYAAQQAGLFGDDTKKATDQLKKQEQAAEDAAAATARQARAAKQLVEEQNKGLKPLFDKLQLEKDSIGLNQTELAIKRNLADAAKTLKIDQDAISNSVRQRIISETTALEIAKQKSQIDKFITDLETERLGLAVRDADQREIVLAIRRQELDFGRALTANERDRLTTELQITQALRQQVEQRNKIKNLVDQYAEQAQKSSDPILAEIKNYELLRNAAVKAYSDAGRAVDDLSFSYNAARDGDYAKFMQTEVAKTSIALSESERRINAEITKEIEKYDQVYKLANQYSTELSTLEDRLQKLKSSGFDIESADYQRLQDTKLEIQRRFNEQSQQLELQRIQNQLIAEQSSIAQSMSSADQATLQKIGLQEKEKQIAADRIAFEKKSDLDKTKFAVDNLQTVFAALGAQNKKAFEASKALAIASALVNTYQGATKALATYPWPFGLIAAAAAVAAGLAQVSAIRSQQYSGRSLGGPVMGNTPYIVGENGPELFTPSTTGSITRNSELQGSSPVNVNFTIVANDTQGFDQLLTSRRGVIQQIISDAMLERGQRSAM